MDNLGILVQAILSLKDTKASKDQIASELPKLESQLQSDKNTRVKIVAGLDIAKSKNLIQSQLNTLANQAKAPAIKVGIDTSGLNSVQGATQNITNGLKSVQIQAKQTASAVQQAFVSMTADDVPDKIVSQFQKSFYIVGKKATETKSQFKSLIAEFNNGWNTGNADAYSKALEDIYRLATQSTKATKGLDENIKQAAQEIRSTMTDGGKITIGKQLREDLKASLGTAGQIKQVLDTVYGVGNWKYASSSRKSFSGKGVYADEMVGSLKDSQSTLDAILSTYEALDKLPKNMTMFDHMDTETAKSEISKYLQEILKLPSAYQTAQSAETTYTQTAIQDVENLGAIADTLSKKLVTIYMGGGQGSQPITDSAHWENLANQANVASLAIDKIRTADSTTAESIKTNAESEIAKLEQLLESYRNIEYSIEEQTKATQELKAIRDSITRDANGNQIGRTTVVGNTGFTITNRYNEKNELTSYTETENYQNMAKAIAKAQTEAIKLTTRLKEVQSTYSDINGTKSVKNQDYLTQLSNQYAIVEKAIKAVENADSATMAQMKANAEQEISILNQLATQYHNAEKVATQLRAKGFETVKIDTGNNIDKFINSINNSKVPIQAMQTEINKLTSDFAQLDTIQDQAGKSAALTNILNTLDNAKTKFQSLKELFKGFGNADWLSVNSEQINKINDMATKIAIYKNNLTATRDEWKSQGIYVGEIQAKVTSLARSLPNIKKPEKFNEWVQEWNDINQKANQLKVNLDSQVATHNKIYEIQSQIAKLNPAKDTAEIARLNEKLSAEQKTLSNLQMQSNVYSNLVSFEQQEQYITEQTAQTRDKLLSATNSGVKQYQTTITNAIGKLQGITNSAVFRNNASNPQVTQTKQEINSLITAYQNLATKLQGNITPAGLETVRTELTQLNARFNDATTTAKRFETELKSDNGAEQLAQKVALLTSRIKAYRQANSKSEKVFGSQYDSMLSQLANPNIDLNAYNAINKQFQKMRQEINAANVAGKNLWQTFKEKLGKFTGWMSMTYAVSLFTRSIRQAVTELKEIDTILTEISKTSDRTEASLRKLGEASFATASKYGQKASDYLLGVQEMSRAGFNENSSEQMAELSILAQSAGDMTAELANEYLIATNAGYQFGGSAEKLNSVLDSQNYITNRNALNMSELAEATKIVASQASQSGIGIDKMTAAVGTMIATTQQGGEVAARALKGKRTLCTIALYGCESIVA